MSSSALSSQLRTAKIIHTILVVLIAMLGILMVGMLIVAALMQFPNGFRDSVMGQLESTGGAIPTVGHMAANALVAAIMAGAYLFVALVVKQIVKTTLDGDPFVEANISRLRKTWMVIALAEVFRMVMMGMLPGAPVGSNEAAMSNFSVDTRLSAWFLVFVIAAMAEVFRIGLELRRDQELTV